MKRERERQREKERDDILAYNYALNNIKLYKFSKRSA